MEGRSLEPVREEEIGTIFGPATTSPEMAHRSIWRKPEGQTLEEFVCENSTRPMKTWTDFTPKLIYGSLTEPDTYSLYSVTMDIWEEENITAVPCSPPPEDILPLRRNYMNTAIQQAIVTFDAETIGPEEMPQHPLSVKDVSSRPSLHARKPWGICVNSKTEQIYIADRAYHDILVFGSDGEFQCHIGRGLLNRPVALAYDSVGDRLFVTDKDSHRIRVFSVTGQLLFDFGGKGRFPGRLLYPWGIAVSKDGAYVAVADAGNRRIQLFSSSGKYLRHFGDSPLGRRDRRVNLLLHAPRSVAFDRTGQFLYVTDFNLHSVLRLDLMSLEVGTPELSRFVSDELELRRPSGIDVDDAGNVILCDTKNHSVKIFAPDGQLVNRIFGTGETVFEQPLDVAVLPCGFLAVLDLNGRVRIF